MKLLYLSGPISASCAYEERQNVLEAEEWMVWLLQKGFAVICPHKNSSQLGGAISYDEWIAQDLEMLRRCDGIAMMPAWRTSRGARIEHEYAALHGIPIYNLPEDLYAMG